MINSEEDMLLYLVQKMRELRVDEQTFFRIAHINLFGTDPDVSNDVAQFKLHSIVPKYVQMYLKRIQHE